jgi:hypothetical protein
MCAAFLWHALCVWQLINWRGAPQDGYTAEGLPRAGSVVLLGARDRASPNFMGVASLVLNISIFCDSLHVYSILIVNAILGLAFLGLALSRPQVQCVDLDHSVAFFPISYGKPLDIWTVLCTRCGAFLWEIGTFRVKWPNFPIYSTIP